MVKIDINGRMRTCGFLFIFFVLYGSELVSETSFLGDTHV